MQHLRDIAQAQLDRPSIVTVGMFDGVHRGHQVLVKRLVERAHASDRLAVVLTFFPHPDTIIHGVTGRYYLTSPDERARLLGQLGVDLVVTYPFDDDVRHMRAEDFVDQLVKYLKPSSLWATSDFALGYKREGNIEYLRERGLRKGFAVETIGLLTDNNPGRIINSSTVRQALEAGDVEQAARYLGRHYAVEGQVVQGDRRGHQIGFPTANIDVWDQKVLPQKGVYACWAMIEGQTFGAVTNVGNRPTFNGSSVTVEAHLLEFDRDIYGVDLSLQFVKRLRGEVKFDGVQALVEQINRDVEAGRAGLRD